MINTVANTVAFIRRTGSDNIHIHLRTFHVNIEEADMMPTLETALPHLVYLELD